MGPLNKVRLAAGSVYLDTSRTCHEALLALPLIGRDAVMQKRPTTKQASDASHRIVYTVMILSAFLVFIATL